MITPADFLGFGTRIINKGDTARRRNELRAFLSHFGTSPDVCADLWSLLITSDYIVDFNIKILPNHLFFGLHRLWCNETEIRSAKFFKVDEKTFRKWSWIIINAMAQLSFDVIRWENRFLNRPRFWTILTSVDGTDFRIEEPTPFDPKWYSHKFKGPGVRYEVVIGIHNKYIVSINGPYPCGAWPDLKIARHDLIKKLIPGERIEADNGYSGEPSHLSIAMDNNNGSRHVMKADIRARHENVNSRFKKWDMLNDKFRYDLDKHGNVFGAVAVITQLEIENGGIISDRAYES